MPSVFTVSTINSFLMQLIFLSTTGWQKGNSNVKGFTPMTSNAIIVYHHLKSGTKLTALANSMNLTPKLCAINVYLLTS